MVDNKLFVFDYRKNNKIFYKPRKDVYVKAIDLDTGTIDYKKVLSYSIHKNIQMYLLKDKKNRFKEFYVSSDHSLIVYDSESNNYKKITPLEVISNKNENNLYLVKDVGDHIEHIPMDDNIELIYVGRRDGYDITVEDFYTFCTDDGIFVQDTVAVYMPMTVEAQRELREKIHGKVKSPATGSIGIELKHGMILGWYRATKDIKVYNAHDKLPRHLTVDSIIEFLKQYPVYYNMEIEFSSMKTKFKKVKTSVSRVLYNLILPSKIEFINKPFDKKLFKQINKICSILLDDEEVLKVYKKLQDVGFLLSSIIPATMSIDELIIPESLKKKVDKLKEISDPVKGMEYLKQLKEELIKYVRKNYPQIADIFDSGARGSWDDLVQMVLAKGYVTDAEGKIIKIPVTKGLADNLNSKEYFQISPSARYGMISRAINTDKPGYLTRRLVFAGSSIHLTDTKDCKTKNYLELKIEDEKMASSLIDRYLDDGTLITLKNYKDFVGKTVKLRSPMYCKDPNGICKKCYGELYKVLDSTEIGTIAAQSIGERGTQLIMRTFHTGGAAEISEIPKVVEDCVDLIQEGSTVIAKVGGKMKFDKTSDYFYSEDTVILKDGILTIEFNDDTACEISVSPDMFYSFELFYDDIKSTDEEIIMTFSKNTNIIEVNLQSQDLLVAINKVQRLFEVTSAHKSKKAEDLLKEILKIYKPYGLRNVHFETILSNMMRNPNNLFELARHTDNPHNHVLIGISQVPFYTSPLLALGFQDISKAVYYGLISKEQGEPKSILEKLLIGEL